MAHQWFYRINGDDIGPVSSQVLKQLAATGTVKQDTPIRKEGRDKWVAARHVKGLLPESGVPELPAPPAQQQGEQAPPPAQKASDVEQWIWLTEEGPQHPQPLSCLHKMFVDGQLKPTDCMHPYDTLREQGVTNPIPAGDLFDTESTVIPDSWRSWTVVSGAVTHGPWSIERIERLYNDNELSDEDTVTRQGCRTLTLGALFNPDEAAQLPCTLPLSQQPDSVQTMATGLIGLLIGLVFGISGGGIIINCVQGFCIGIGLDYVASKSGSGKRLATAPVPVITALTLCIGLVGPMWAPVTEPALSTFLSPLGLGGGPKLRAFKKVVSLLKSSPSWAAGEKAHVQFNERVKKAFRQYEAIPFDPTKKRAEAQQIVELYDSDVDGRFTGEIVREIEISTAEIANTLRSSE